MVCGIDMVDDTLCLGCDLNWWSNNMMVDDSCIDFYNLKNDFRSFIINVNVSKELALLQ